MIYWVATSFDFNPLLNRFQMQVFNAAPNNRLSQNFHGMMSGNALVNGLMSPPDGGFGQLSDMNEHSHYYEKGVDPSDNSEYEYSGQEHKSRRNQEYDEYKSDSQGQRSSYPAYTHHMNDYQVDTRALYGSLPRQPPPNTLVLGGVDEQGFSSSLSRLGLPLCDGITVNRTSLRTPLLEDDRESCV